MVLEQLQLTSSAADAAAVLSALKDCEAAELVCSDMSYNSNGDQKDNVQCAAADCSTPSELKVL